MNYLPLIVVLLSVVGCTSEQSAEQDRGSLAQPATRTNAVAGPPERVKRRKSAAVIDDHPALEAFIGEWSQDGSDKLVKFVRNPDRSVTVIHPYPFDLWDSVVDNVRMIEGKLHFDVYYYYSGTESFGLSKTEDHPYSGKINEMSVWPGSNEDELIEGFSGIELPLKRAK